MTRSAPLKIGDRFELTAEARRKLPRMADKRGRIVGESRDGRCWKILFDGNITRTSIHKDFVQREQT